MRLFISYRRDDSAGHAGRIADQLAARYGADAVFMDVEAIEAGEDFVEAIGSAIAEADAVLVVIGPGWLRATLADGRPRLEDPADFVRLEVEEALRAQVRTIPLLVNGASMPTADELPPTMAPLSRLNAIELVDRRFLADIDALFAAIDRRPARAEPAGGIHLPAQPTPFVGRVAELAAVHDLLARNDVRVLTLTGPGGTGKTRLSIEAASTLSDAYPDGVWFVGLASLRDPELIVPTIAATLGVQEGGGSNVDETLHRFLRDRRLLLVIDNAEQLLPDASVPLGGLTDAADGLRMVVSSREALMVRAERVYPVHELTAEDGIELFVDRARPAIPGFELDEANTSVIEEICARLEGLPLAIELTTARLRVLSPSELLTRLDARLPLLVGGARDAPERQRTMRATIAWSYDLLTRDEQRSFAHLAVFRGGCTLDAAEDVCGADLDTMASLVEKSLLRTEQRPAGLTRYRTLETIREFALERLTELPEAGKLRRRHADRFLAFANEALPGIKHRDQDEWLERLEAEHDNIRSALRWSLDEGPPGMALELTSTMWLFWYMRGHLTEGRAWLTESLRTSAGGSSEARALALAGTGWLAGELGDHRAAEFLEEAYRSSSEASPTTRAIILTFLGGYLPDDPERARTLSAEAISVAREADDRWMLAIATNNLAELYREAGEAERATAMYEESYRIARRMEDPFHQALYLNNLGEMALLAGDLARARELLSESQSITGQRGDRRHLAAAEVDLGWVSLAEGRFDEAERRFRESLRLDRDLGSVPMMSSPLKGLAAVAAAGGDDERAGRLLGIAEASEDEVGELPTPPDAGVHLPHLRAAQARAGAAWDRYLQEGREIDLDGALDYALG